MSVLTRRQFVVGAGVSSLGLAAGCGRLSWQAAQPGKIARVGYLSPSASGQSPLYDALLDGLRERGWVEGQNLVIEGRSAENQLERLPDLAAELVRLKVDLIVAAGTA